MNGACLGDASQNLCSCNQKCNRFSFLYSFLRKFRSLIITPQKGAYRQFQLLLRPVEEGSSAEEKTRNLRFPAILLFGSVRQEFSSIT